MIGTITAEVGLSVLKKIAAAWLANKGTGETSSNSRQQVV